VTARLTSVVSFPERGPWGDARYHGNCSGHLVRMLVDLYQPRLVVDPMEGSGTSRQVCRDRGVPYRGLDLREGFDLAAMPLRERLPGPADLVFLHPPYWDLVRYSGGEWGDAPDERDLSRVPTYAAYLALLERCVENCLDALAPDGRLALLLGDIRRLGRYYSPQAAVISWYRVLLDGVWIKVQHHCRSDAVTYEREERLVRIAHEYLLLLRKA